MNPKPTSNGENTMSVWIKIASTLGVGTAFGAAAFAMMFYGFIEPSNERQDRTEIRQEKLVESIIQTNTALTNTNQANTETLKELKDAAIASSATVLVAVESNGKLIGQHFEITKANQSLNETQVEILQGVQAVHSKQIEQMGEIVKLIDSANQMMAPVAEQRQQLIDKQGEQNVLLKELVEETKKKN